MRLATLAVERYYHALRERLAEADQARSSEISPIFALDHRTLVAVPVGNLGTDGLSHFLDRILSRVLYSKPKKVLLVLEELASENERSTLLERLKAELHGQKVQIAQI